MSKFKVGDRVQAVGGYSPWDNAPDVLVVKRNHGCDLISLENDPMHGESKWDTTKLWVHPARNFKLTTKPTRTLTLSGTTYTLTPYEAPKLVTIDDVVYVMTEVV